jgi:hypothetical protein
LLKFQAREEVANRISLFKSWFPVRLRKRPPFGTPVMSQRIPIHAGSLGRVQGQVEFFRKIQHVPLATVASRTPYVIYLDNRSKISKGDRKKKSSKKRLIATNRFILIIQLIQ